MTAAPSLPTPTPVDVSAAARWLATTPDHRRPQHVVPHMRKQFGLSACQAVAAIREANLIRARAH